MRCKLCKKVRNTQNGSFFKVSNEERRPKWSKFCGLEFQMKELVCSDHFDPSYIIKAAEKVFLLPNAVPNTNEQKCTLCHRRGDFDNGFLFRVPQDETKRNLWSELCGIKFLPSSMICTNHFSENSFIRYRNRLALLPDAVPLRPGLSIKQIQINNGTEERVIDDDNRSEISVNIPMTSSCLLLDDPLSLNKVSFVEPETVSKQYTNKERVSFVEPETVRKQYVNKEIQTDPSMFGYEKYSYKCRQLETQIKELKLQLMRSSMAMNSLYKIFTEGQVRKLTSPTDIHWSEYDMENAWQLYKKGSGAYKYLYKKGFPLPHISSIQRWQRKNKKNKINNSTEAPTNENNEDVDAVVEEEKEEEEELDFSGDDNDWFDDFYEEEGTVNNDKISEENNVSTIKTKSELIQNRPPRCEVVKDKNQDVRKKINEESKAPTINVPSQYASPELNAIIASSNTKFFIAKKPTEVEILKEPNLTISAKEQSKSSTAKEITAIKSPISQYDVPDLNNIIPAKKVKATDAIEQGSSEKQNVIAAETQIEPLYYNEFLKSLNSGDFIIKED